MLSMVLKRTESEAGLPGLLRGWERTPVLLRPEWAMGREAEELAEALEPRIPATDPATGRRFAENRPGGGKVRRVAPMPLRAGGMDWVWLRWRGKTAGGPVWEDPQRALVPRAGARP